MGGAALAFEKHCYVSCQRAGDTVGMLESRRNDDVSMQCASMLVAMIPTDRTSGWMQDASRSDETRRDARAVLRCAHGLSRDPDPSSVPRHQQQRSSSSHVKHIKLLYHREARCLPVRSCALLRTQAHGTRRPTHSSTTSSMDGSKLSSLP